MGFLVCHPCAILVMGAEDMAGMVKDNQRQSATTQTFRDWNPDGEA